MASGYLEEQESEHSREVVKSDGENFKESESLEERRADAVGKLWWEAR